MSSSFSACTVCDHTTTGQENSGYESTACALTADTVCSGRYTWYDSAYYSHWVLRILEQIVANH